MGDCNMIGTSTIFYFCFNTDFNTNFNICTRASRASRTGVDAYVGMGCIRPIQASWRNVQLECPPTQKPTNAISGTLKPDFALFSLSIYSHHLLRSQQAMRLSLCAILTLCVKGICG